MICPLNENHKLTEISKGLWQCATCGYGPHFHTGFHPNWSIYNIEENQDNKNVMEADIVLYMEALYYSGKIIWLKGSIPGSVETYNMERVDPAYVPCPVIWEGEIPQKPKLRTRNYYFLGKKEIF